MIHCSRRVRPALGLQALGGLVVDDRAGVLLVGQDVANRRFPPTHAAGRGNALGVEVAGDLPLVETLLDKEQEDLLDHLHLRGVPRHEHHAAVLDGLALAGLQDAVRLLLLIEHQPVEPVGRRPARTVALVGNLRGALEDLLAQGAAVLGALVAVDALSQLGDQAVFVAAKADLRVDDLLAVLSAERLVVRRQVGILEPAPAAHVQDKNQLKFLGGPHQVHHLIEGGPALGIQTAFASVGELVDDLDGVLFGKGAHVVLLNLDAVLLADLGAVAVVGHGAKALQWLFLRVGPDPPRLHRPPSVGRGTRHGAAIRLTHAVKPFTISIYAA